METVFRSSYCAIGEKIRKLTGLDLRQFDHAIVFRVALMVRQYLASRENR